MRKDPFVPVQICLYFQEDDRRLVVLDRGVLVQQRLTSNGWQEDEEPWTDIAMALKRASKLIQVAKWGLELPGILASSSREVK